MSPGQRTALISLGLVLAGGLGALAWSLAGETDPGPGTALERHAAASSRAPSPERSDQPLAELVRSAATRDGAPTSLAVVVTDPDGRPVPQATVVLRSADGGELTGTGSPSWEEFPPGEWILIVRTEEHLNHRETIAVTAGVANRFAVRLAESFIVRGRVIDRFGKAHGRSRTVWFLREGEVHPADEKAGRKLLGASLSSLGSFVVELRHTGQFRLSVGPPGASMMAMVESVRLHPGGPNRVEIVVPGGTHLTVEVDNLPSEWSRADGRPKIAILAAPGSRSADGGRRRDAGGDRRREGRGAVAVQGPTPMGGGRALGPGSGQGARQGSGPGKKGQRGQPPGQDPLSGDGVSGEGTPGETPSATPPREWRAISTHLLNLERAVQIPSLPEGVELRMSLIRRRDRYESTQTFVLQANRRSVLRFSLPPTRTKPEIKAQPVGEVGFFLDVLPSSADGLQTGFHWEE